MFCLVDNSARSKFYFIFEFCDHDLAGILRNVNVKFTLGHIKSIMQQLLDGTPLEARRVTYNERLFTHP